MTTEDLMQVHQDLLKTRERVESILAKEADAVAQKLLLKLHEHVLRASLAHEDLARLVYGMPARPEPSR